MRWKKISGGPEQTSPDARPGLYAQLRAEVTQMRNQGDDPDKDPGSFSRFSCDLCRSPQPLTGLRQCVVCGRWACGGCWTPEFYICHSCAGTLRLLMLPAEGDEKAITSIVPSPEPQQE